MWLASYALNKKIIRALFFNAGLALVEDYIWRSCMICVPNRILFGRSNQEALIGQGM